MSKNMKKLLAVALALAMTMCLLAGCGGSSSSGGGSSEGGSTGGGTLNFGAQMYSDGIISPTYDTNGAWNLMRFGVGEALFKFNDNMEVEPWLAESAETEDNKTWVIKIKSGIKFSNGDDMTPSKVAASLQHMLDDGPNGSATPEKYVPYESKITADDEAGTVTIELPDVNFNLPGNLAYPVCSITNVDATEDWNNGVIGTGPYVVEKFQDQVGYTMKKNENYYEDVPFDTVEIKFMGDASAKAMALNSGEIDVAENITNVSDIQSFQDNDAYTVNIASGVRCGFAWMNMKEGELTNKELRKAVLMAIDYDTICQSNTIGGLYTAGFSVLPSTLSYGYDNLKNPYAYDPDAAKKLLDEAGIKDTDGDGFRELDGKNIDLKFVSYENRLLNDFSDAFAQYLGEVGIKVTADYGSSDDQWSKLVAFDYDLNNNNWTTVGNGDPTEYMANWYSKSEANYCGYKSDEYDKLYESLLKESDTDKRAEILQEMQQVLVDDAVAIIDGYYNSSMIFNKSKISNAPIHTADYYWITTEITPAA